MSPFVESGRPIQRKATFEASWLAKLLVVFSIAGVPIASGSRLLLPLLLLIISPYDLISCAAVDHAADDVLADYELHETLL